LTIGEGKRNNQKRLESAAVATVGTRHSTHDDITLKIGRTYAVVLYSDPGATLDDLREAVTTLEETERTARRVLGGAHPTTTGIEDYLQVARAVLRAREAPPTSG